MAENQYGEWVPDNWQEAEPISGPSGYPAAIDPFGDVSFPGGNRYGTVTYYDPDTDTRSQYPNGWGANSPAEVASAGVQRYGPAWQGMLRGGDYALAASPATGAYHGGPWGAGNPPAVVQRQYWAPPPEESQAEPQTPWERYLRALWRLGYR